MTLKEAIKTAQTENPDEELSHMKLCQRVEKTEENKYGFQYADTIPVDKPAVLFLGGNSATTDRAANGYMSSLDKLLSERNIKEGTGIYSIIYDFKHGDAFERWKIFDEHHVPRMNGMKRKYISDHEYVTINPDKSFSGPFPFPKDANNPNYVKELFEKAFLHRIADENGHKLPVDEACKRMRNLTVAAHCHGAYVFLKTEEMLQKKMKELGFSNEESAKIQKELLCVAYAPETPLGISKSTMISFASESDGSMSIENNFEKELHTLAWYKEFLAYFQGKQGEVFIANKMYDDKYYDGYASDKDHGFLGYEGTPDDLVDQGKLLISFFYNAVAEGVKSSVDGKPLPSIEDLVCGKETASAEDYKTNKTKFDAAQKDGQKLWNKIIQNARINAAARRKNQKN